MEASSCDDTSVFWSVIMSGCMSFRHSSSLHIKARERVRDFELFERHATKMITVLQVKASNKESVDIQDLLLRFTMDTAGEFLFGTSDFNTLDLPLNEPGKASLGPKGCNPPPGDYAEFVKAFEWLQVAVPMRNLSSRFVWPLLEMWTDISKG